MDIKAIIESGMLEQYVLGLLSEKEEQSIEQYANDYPEIREALNDIEDALAKVAQNNTLSMPEHLPRMIFQKIDGLASEKDLPNNNQGRQSNLRVWFYILLVVAILLTILAFLLNSQKQAIEENLSQAEIQFAAEIENCEDEKAQLQLKLDIIRIKGTEQISLDGTDNAPQAIAKVYFNKETNKSYLDIINMPDVPPGKQFQLWALLPGDQSPKDMGVFDVDPNSIALREITFVAEATGFAVTLEDEGGKPRPDLSALVIIGTFS